MQSPEDRCKSAYLRQYQYARRREKWLREDLVGWHEQAKILKGLSVPVGAAAERVATLERKLTRQIELAVLLRENIETAIDRVADDKVQKIFELYYLHGMTWEQVAEKMHYSVQHIHRIHDKALAMIELVSPEKSGDTCWRLSFEQSAQASRTESQVKYVVCPRNHVAIRDADQKAHRKGVLFSTLCDCSFFPTKLCFVGTHSESELSFPLLVIHAAKQTA